MDASIVIVSFNTSRILDECIESIKKETRCTFEIIVVDNASTDDSCLMVKEKHPDAILIENRQNGGFAKANNQGFAVAHGRHYLMLNPDTVILEGAIDKLVEFIDQHDDVAICGPRNIGVDGKLQYNCDNFPSFWNVFWQYTNLNNWFPSVQLFRESRMFFEDYSSEQDVDKIMGCSLMVRASIFNNFGGLDENYFMYFEETDLCFRAKKNGARVVYMPNAVILHYGGKSSLSQDKEAVVNKTIYSYYLKSKYYFFDKNYGYLPMIAMRILDFSYGIALILRNSFRKEKDKKAKAFEMGNELLKNSVRFCCGKVPQQ